MKKFTILMLVAFLGISSLMSQTIRNVPSTYPTIQGAINASNNGDTVIVDAGTYNVASSQILINRSIILRAKTGLASKPKITTSYTSYSNCAVSIYANNVILDGFEIDGSSAFSTFPATTSNYLVGDYNSSTNIGFNNWTVKNCYIHNCREGLRLSANTGVTIQGNEVAQTVKHCIDCSYSTCYGLKVTQNWLHSENSPYGSKPAGIAYLCSNIAGASVEISYNYCTACRTFCDLSKVAAGNAPNSDINIIHNTVDWKLAAVPATVLTTDNGQQMAIAFWAEDGTSATPTQSWISSHFKIRDNIFSRMKWYEVTATPDNWDPLSGPLELKNNLFSQWFLCDAYYASPNISAVEWPAARGAVGSRDFGSGNGFTYTNNIQASPIYASTGTTASAYYVLQAGSPALYAATDGTNIGANQYQPPMPAATPTFSVVAGTYTATQTVSITTTTSGASIRYTTDGTTPSDASGTIYTDAVSISQNMTLKAIAYKTNYINSSVTSGVYNIKCTTPTYNLSAGTYVNARSVAITCTTIGATIRYTTDGSTPTPSSGTIYSGAVNIASSSTLKAIAYKSAMTNSDVSSAYYIINIDTDNDGVLDADDAYPTDSTRAFNNYFPAAGLGSLAFEDLWPSKGDYDMNDIVVDYQFKNVTNADNKLVETFATFTLRATGASYHSGFGFQLSSNNIPNSAMQVTGYVIHENYLMLNTNGTEQGQNKPTIIVFDNAFDVLQYPGSGYGINTIPGITYVTPVTITIHITYTPNTYTAADLDITHFNPFIIVNKERGKEVHLPDYAPTALVNPAYFGTGDDKSNPSQGKYYKTANNLPWALNLSSTFSYPIEKAEITKAYLHFIHWVLNNGTLYTDWYTNTAAGYRDNNYIYSSGKK